MDVCFKEVVLSKYAMDKGLCNDLIIFISVEFEERRCTEEMVPLQR
jgi:hypothetical protein